MLLAHSGVLAWGDIIIGALIAGLVSAALVTIYRQIREGRRFISDDELKREVHRLVEQSVEKAIASRSKSGHPSRPASRLNPVTYIRVLVKRRGTNAEQPK